jgi:hypothetical protein
MHRCLDGVEDTQLTAKEGRQRLRKEYWVNKEGAKHGLKEKRRKLRKVGIKAQRKGREEGSYKGKEKRKVKGMKNFRNTRNRRRTERQQCGEEPISVSKQWN